MKNSGATVGSIWWKQDLPLRALGVTSMFAAIVATQHLVGTIHNVPRHPATDGELALAAVSFLGFSLGGALTFLGAHIHDEVEIARRWRAQPAGPLRNDRLSKDEWLSRFDLQGPDPASRSLQLVGGRWIQR